MKQFGKPGYACHKTHHVKDDIHLVGLHANFSKSKFLQFSKALGPLLLSIVTWILDKKGYKIH